LNNANLHIGLFIVSLTEIEIPLLTAKSAKIITKITKEITDITPKHFPKQGEYKLCF